MELSFEVCYNIIRQLHYKLAKIENLKRGRLGIYTLYLLFSLEENVLIKDHIMIDKLLIY